MLYQHPHHNNVLVRNLILFWKSSIFWQLDKYQTCLQHKDLGLFAAKEYHYLLHEIPENKFIIEWNLFLVILICEIYFDYSGISEYFIEHLHFISEFQRVNYVIYISS